MRGNRVAVWVVVLLAGSCRQDPRPGKATRFPLAELRAAFVTHLPAEDAKAGERESAPVPPPEFFELVEYPAPLGNNVAYVTPVRSGPRRPAIVWIAGGFDWGIDDSSWQPQPRTNDQSAAAFRKAGIVLMRPSLRGANQNPGRKEYFLGEVDDILAAADYLASRADVDPSRIYLGGHSTGGTLALLAAESTARFRTVFAFGPAGNVAGYGGSVPFRRDQKDELRVRSPSGFLSTIVTPTFVIEGTDGNIGSFHFLRQASKGAPVHFVPLFGLTHFNGLALVSEVLSKKILADTGAEPAIALPDEEIDQLIVSWDGT